MLQSLSVQNSYRLKAKLIISLSPGIHLRKLQKLLGASFSTTRYHVGKLERDGDIVCAKDGRYHRLYLVGTNDGMREVYATLQAKTTRNILRALVDNQNGLTNGNLSKLLNLPRSTISEHVALLGRIRLVRRSVTVEGHILYEVQEREKILRLLAVFEKNLLNVAADGFIDLWDF
jgi:predicted transcriptional regulator